MKRTRVKICGITTVEDAALAVELGYDAIGLNFYEPSPRSINIDQAKLICDSLPAFMSIVALFVNPSKQLVDNIIKHLPIDVLQFHGDEEESFCKSFNKNYIKAFSQKNFNKFHNFSSAKSLLVDSFDPNSIGGTGKVFDWNDIPEAYQHKVILAGGLNATNASLAITQVSPYALDVSSGVEKIDESGDRIKGIKDHQQMMEFMQAVQSADKLST